MRTRLSELPSLNALRAFDAAGRHLSFRLAAMELGVTQSAVAQHVRGLEAELGIKLFERLPRALALTEPGRHYLEQIRKAFALIMDATAALRPVPLQLTISVTPTFAAKWLIPRLSTFMTAYPMLDLRIQASEAIANFQSDGIDIAVRQSRPPFGPGLSADLLFRQDVIAVCSPALVATATENAAGLPREQTSSNARLASSAIEHFALLHDGHSLWPDFITHALKSSPASSTRNIRFNQTSLALEAAIAGQGLALASRFLVESDLAAGRLVDPFGVSLHGPLDFYVVSPRKPSAGESIASVRQWLFSQRDAASLKLPSMV
ncbi:LysR family transcriptional regulator [Pigmentiphaga aceris]|uniref:LysR family transcriptional regulator n=1 Tax=Pigmentiphaga aceris TaxID=1940612 RepID=A0A5C0AY74_9BURK|nr:LysR substrate-binding domain-containing protein [Pigmentiphaga aceris]QEI06686.1 LysR family transcriptional regulator [Pigmentiphaga aceris]